MGGPGDAPGRPLKAQLSSGKGEVVGTNCYKVNVPKVSFSEAEALTDKQIHAILLGSSATNGPEMFDENVTVGSVNVGVRRLLVNFPESEVLDGGLSETIQGEPLFGAVLDDAGGLAHELLRRALCSSRISAHL